jgi:capsular exopolysaccharide synthesis family protein
MRYLPPDTGARQIAHPHAVVPEYMAVNGPAAEADSAEHARLYIEVLRRRKWCIITPLLIVLPFLMVNLAIEKPSYMAKTRVLIEKDAPQVLQIQDIIQNDPSLDFYQTEASLITSRDNLAEVVKLLQLDQQLPEDPWLIQAINTALKTIRQLKTQVMTRLATTLGNETPSPAVVDPDELRRMRAIDVLLPTIQVLPVEATRLVDVSITGVDPWEVTQQVNTLIEVYGRKNREKRLETSRQAIDWLTRKSADLYDKMQAAEKALQDFREKNNLVALDADGKRNLIQERLGSIYTAYAQANTARMDFETRFTKITGLSAENLENIENLSLLGDNTIIWRLRQTYLELLAQYRNTAQTYTPKHPALVQLQAQIDETKRALHQELQKTVQAMQAEYNILRSKEGTLSRELNTQKDSTLGLGHDMIAYAALQREADNHRNLYLETAKRLEELKLTQASITDNVMVVEKAIVPLLPVSSQATLKLLGSLVLSGMFGVGLVFIKEYFANRFTNTDEMERYLRLSFLGVIPRYAVNKRRGGGLIALHEPMSAAAEAYCLLRTRIFSLMHGMRMLLVTSACPAEGKSTTIANLGVSFAQLGLKVLLVDADLRRPTLHRQFQLPKDRGLTTILRQEADWQSVLCETRMPNLHVLPAGPLSHNPSDLLCLGSLRQLFDQVTREFDLVLVDAPLILSLPDVEILASDMDAVVLVHDSTQCDKKSVLEARRHLERVRANTLGIVWNNIEPGNQYYYHRYARSYQIDSPVSHYDHPHRGLPRSSAQP